MISRLQSAVLAFGIGLVALTLPLDAHHAFSAEFAADMPVSLEGTITRVEWINPHSWIHIDVEGADGTVPEVDDRRRPSGEPAQARLDEGYGAARYRGPGRGVSGEGWLATGQRQGYHVT